MIESLLCVNQINCIQYNDCFFWEYVFFPNEKDVPIEWNSCIWIGYIENVDSEFHDA